MHTTIKKKATAEQMEKLFDATDKINIRHYQGDGKGSFSVVVRHNENENASQLFDKALREISKPPTHTKTIQVKINLQEGLFMNEDLNQVYAAYSKHHKVIFIQFAIPEIVFPEEFEGYKKITRFTDGLSLSLWREGSFKSFYELVEEHKNIQHEKTV